MLALINDTGMLVVLLTLVVLFGASRLPKLARNLGEAGREFRKAHDETDPADVTPAPVPTRAALTGPAQPAGDSLVTLTRGQLDALVAAGEPGPGSPQPAA